MQIRSFGSLIYRELFLARKNIGRNIFALFLFSILGIMIQLSFQYGNLALIPKESLTDAQEMITMSLYLFPLLMTCGIGFALCESAQREVYKPWMRFYHTTPVGCVKLSLAKYVTLFLMNVVSVIFSVIYLMIIGEITNTGFSIQQLSVVAVVLGVVNAFGGFLQVFTMLLGSLDKAGILMLGVLIAAEFFVMTFVVPQGGWTEKALTWELIQFWCMNHLEISLLILLASYVVGGVATAMLYKRREK